MGASMRPIRQHGSELSIFVPAVWQHRSSLPFHSGQGRETLREMGREWGSPEKGRFGGEAISSPPAIKKKICYIDLDGDAARY